jgi:hypothetical protein
MSNIADSWHDEEPTRSYRTPFDTHVVEDGAMFLGVVEADSQVDAENAARKFLVARRLLTAGQK